ncbi:hypothetical protein LIER_27616 [Lithospermum erythrorhizon]|uniref:Uncharacterized protein n=1 Tax=Lithospermum erythrorhizon TaxID=34254 RepID=A0AAV3RG98_LITER
MDLVRWGIGKLFMLLAFVGVLGLAMGPAVLWCTPFLSPFCPFLAKSLLEYSFDFRRKGRLLTASNDATSFLRLAE